jgi:3-hydroxyisobutyrate dehydrogenase
MAGDSVAFLGAGSTMGLPMARNLAEAGVEVSAWNRTPEKAEPLADHGVRMCQSPREAIEGAGVVLTMLANGDAVLEAIETELPAAGEDTVWLQMSTIGEAATERCAQLASEHQLVFFDAPVLGTRQPAEERKLVILASGPENVKDRVQPIFDALGQKTIWVGEAGSGTRLKIATNSWVLTVTEGCAETIALAQGLDLDPSLLFEAFDGGTLDLPYFKMKGKMILERRFEPSFRLELAAKDAGLVEDSAQRHGLDLPLFSTIKQRMLEGAEEHGDEDMAATWFTSAPRQLAREH